MVNVRSVSRSISRTLRMPTASWLAIARAVLDAARALGDDEADELTLGHERDGQAAASRAGRELRARAPERPSRSAAVALAGDERARTSSSPPGSIR